MQLIYKVVIDNPSSHFVSVNISGQIPENQDSFTFFLPSWSPGSYLMREYPRNVRRIQVTTEKGENMYFTQTAKGQWEVKPNHKGFQTKGKEFSLTYDVYCHELTCRTSHVDESHAFLHGPSFLMGVLGESMENPEITLEFPPLWSKVTTGLKDISPSREVFRYTAKDYDELIDAPFEIGCHETDGFRYGGKDHELAFYGPSLPHGENLKKDIETIVAHVAETMGEIPYEEKYTFITHLLPNKYGGLEHLNSTALQFCSFNLNDRKGYVKWLELVAHEYFHTWNVKRIRPKELGPFNYVEENYTKMHWLTEGLTSFMDQLFVLRSGLCSLEEYAEMMKENINRYLLTPGRRFHSLEDSSFNAWVKLYRPDENSINSSISYYLKGGLVFMALQSLWATEGININSLLKKLWDRYKENPAEGMEDHEVFQMIEDLSSKEIRGKFETMIQTTEELDFATIMKNLGMSLQYEVNEKPSLGIRTKFSQERVIVSSVELDGPGYKSGINAEDEIISINGMRLLKSNFTDVSKRLMPNKKYHLMVSRLGVIHNLEVIPGEGIITIKEVKIEDQELMKKALGV